MVLSKLFIELGQDVYIFCYLEKDDDLDKPSKMKTILNNINGLDTEKRYFLEKVIFVDTFYDCFEEAPFNLEKPSVLYFRDHGSHGLFNNEKKLTHQYIYDFTVRFNASMAFYAFCQGFNILRIIDPLNLAEDNKFCYFAAEKVRIESDADTSSLVQYSLRLFTAPYRLYKKLLTGGHMIDTSRGYSKGSIITTPIGKVSDIFDCFCGRNYRLPTEGVYNYFFSISSLTIEDINLLNPTIHADGEALEVLKASIDKHRENHTNASSSEDWEANMKRQLKLFEVNPEGEVISEGEVLLDSDDNETVALPDDVFNVQNVLEDDLSDDNETVTSSDDVSSASDNPFFIDLRESIYDATVSTWSYYKKRIWYISSIILTIQHSSFR